MHPQLHEQMAKQRMKELQREAAAWQRAKEASASLDNKTGDHSFTRILWYLLFGLRIPNYKHNQAALRHEITLDRFQERLNAAMRVVSLVALGLGLLIGSFLDSKSGMPLPVLLSGAILLIVALPVLVRSAGMLRKQL